MSENTGRFKVVILTTKSGLFAVQRLVKHLDVSAIIIDTGKSQPSNAVSGGLIQRLFTIYKNEGILSILKNVKRRFFDGNKSYYESMFEYCRNAEKNFLWKVDRKAFKNSFMSKISDMKNFMTWQEINDFYGIPVKYVDDINSAEAENIIRSCNCDLGIIAGGRILKDNIISIPRLGFINKHSSILPKHRGLAAEFWCLYYEDFEHLGVTVHQVTPKLDNGGIIVQKKIKFEKNDYAHTLRIKSDIIGSEAIVEAVKIMEKGNFIPLPQDESKATYNKKPTKNQIEDLNAKLPRLWKETGE